MGEGNKKTEAVDAPHVTSAEKGPDPEEKEQKDLINSLLLTIRHFFGAFPPSVQ